MKQTKEYRQAALEEERQAFVDLLRRRIVTFHYRKSARTLVKRRGTLCLRFIPEEAHPKGTGHGRANSDYVNYYDFTAGGWRTFDLRRVTSFYPDSISETIMESEVQP